MTNQSKQPPTDEDKTFKKLCGLTFEEMWNELLKEMPDAKTLETMLSSRWAKDFQISNDYAPVLQKNGWSISKFENEFHSRRIR